MSKRSKLTPLPLVPGDRMTQCVVCSRRGGKQHKAICHGGLRIGDGRGFWCRFIRPSLAAACGLRFCMAAHVAQHHEWCESYKPLPVEHVGGGC